MIMKYIFYLLIFCNFRVSFSFNPRDCLYNSTTYHVQYICDVEWGAKFFRSNSKLLYCNNYSLGINRGNIQIVSFENCKRSKLANEYFDMFPELRVLNISNTDIKSIQPYDLKFSKYLEEFIASNNQLTVILADLFSYTSELISLDLSYNQILNLSPFTFDNVRKLKSMNLSFNSIEKLDKRLFTNLFDLEYLDLSNNRIKIIDNNLINYNRKLKTINLNNNQVERLSCEFLIKLMGACSLQVFVNTLVNLDSGCSNDNTHINIEISISTDNLLTNLNISETRFNWTFNSDDFDKLRNLNFSNNRVENISLIMEQASTQLESLDLSNNFIGELTPETFHKFVNLKKLYLSRTGLSNFQFATFYHQRNLEALDISFNNLYEVDFYLFLRNFQSLRILNLEGNNLIEIDSITRTHFPQLSVLAISKNQFTCDYLVKFLLQWNNLTLIDNPSNQTHLGGIDCIHENSYSFALASHGHLQDIVFSNIFWFAIMIFVLIFIFSMVILGKCHHVTSTWRRKCEEESNECSVVGYKKDEHEIQQNNSNQLIVFA